MQALDRAHRWLERNRIAEVVVEVRAAEAETERLARELALVEGRVPWWERANVFHDSPDELRAEALRADLEASGKFAADARRRRDEMVGSSEAGPPIAIVFRVEIAIERVLARPSAGRVAKKAEPDASTFDAIAERVESIWMPGLVISALADRLQTVEGPLSGAPRAPSRDPELGWAPAGPEELFASAARHVVSGGKLAKAHARLAGARFERVRLADELRALEAQVGLIDRILPTRSRTEQARDAAGLRVRESDGDIVAAIEGAHLAVVQALAAAHPMMWVAMASRAVAATLRAARRRSEHTVSMTGGLHSVNSPYVRCVTLACLVELRRACEAAFPGLAKKIAPRRSAEPSSSGRAKPGPYRVQGFATRRPPPRTTATTEEGHAVFSALDGSALRGEIGWAVAHATVLGLIERTRARAVEQIGWLDRVVVWSDSDEESLAKALAERREWHRQLLVWRAARALQLVEGYAQEHPRHRLGRAIATSHQAVSAVTTPGGKSRSPRDCPIIGRDVATRELQRTLAHFGESFGGIVDRARLVELVCQRIERATHPIASPSFATPSFATPSDARSEAEIIDLFAGALQRTAFVALVREVQARRPAAGSARARERTMDSQVSLVDRVNIFTDSAEERARDQAKVEASAHERAIRSRSVEADALLRQALTLHPPTLLAQQGAAALTAAQAMHARSVRKTRTTGTGNNRRTETYYVCQVFGRGAARSQIALWAADVIRAVGTFPCAGDFMEEWVTSQLR